MLTRVAAARTAGFLSLGRQYARRSLQPYGINSQLASQRDNCFRSLSANFSMSSKSKGMFAFWGKKDGPVGENTEKVFTFDDKNLESATFDSSKILDDQNMGTTQEIETQDFTESAPVADGSADFAGTLDNLPETLTTFSDYGLGGGIMPHRLFQDILEYLTTTVGLEWIPAIAVLTVIARIFTIPGNIAIRRHSARSHNLFPETLKKMEAVQKAAAEQNQFKMRKAQLDYMEFLRTSGTSPVRPLLINLPNMVIFASMFMGIRQMCIAKLPSLVNGGCLWFMNLTIPDPYMILPLVSCVSMSLIIRSGAAEAEMGAAANIDGFRKILMWMPIVSLPFLVFQPAAMFAFWVVSNCFSVMVMMLLQNQGVQKIFGIPKRVRHDKSVAKKMEKATNPIEIFRKAKEAGKQRKELQEKVQKYQKEIKRMQEFEKRNRK